MPVTAPIAGPAEVGPPRLKNRPAHMRLNTPLWGPCPVALGNSASARSYQVICGTIASILLSCAAAISAMAPPYEPPAMPTLGSPFASSWTSGRLATQSTSWRTSLTS